jgi:hypothetical protein
MARDEGGGKSKEVKVATHFDTKGNSNVHQQYSAKTQKVPTYQNRPMELATINSMPMKQKIY